MADTVKYDLLDPSLLYEEETLSGYKAEHFYPVNVGDIFRDRYSVIGKLGYGSASTVWMCHDLQKGREYVALKVYINRLKQHREVPVYKHINSINSQHHGRNHIRSLLDSFELVGPHGTHICLVHEPLGMTLEELRELFDDLVFSQDLIRQTLRDILRAMHFLHKEAGVIHTDIQPNNILMGALDTSAFQKYDKYETMCPAPRKELSDRKTYASRPMPLTHGAPSLCDLSEARCDTPENVDMVMPKFYRAPEVVLGMPWSFPVDVWGFAMTLWDLFEPKRIFKPHGEDGCYSEHLHLAQMVAIMGPPPLEFLQRSEKSKLFWDEEGGWIGNVAVPETSPDIAETRLDGDEKALFLNFMRKMLQWKPEDRQDLTNVLMDEWFLADLIESGEVVREE